MTDIADFVVASRCSCCGQVTDNYWTPDRMIEALRAWVREHGELPRSTDWAHGRPGHPPQGFVCKVFGQWNNLVRAAGYTPHKGGQRPWTKDRIAEAMLDHLLRTGRWPTTIDWGGRRGDIDRPHYRTVYSHFANWEAARRYAGWTGDAPEEYVDPRCAECGAELENSVIGCKTCHDRHLTRKKRQAETAAVSTENKAAVSDRRRVAA